MFQTLALQENIIPVGGPDFEKGPKKPDGIYTPSIDVVLEQFPQLTTPERPVHKVRILVHYYSWPDSIPLNNFSFEDPATWVSNLRKNIPSTDENLVPLSGLAGSAVTGIDLLSNGMFTPDILNRYQLVDPVNKRIAKAEGAVAKAENALKEMVSRVLTGFILANALSDRGYEVEIVNAAAGTAGDKTTPTETIQTLFTQYQTLYGNPESNIKLIDIPFGWNTFEEMKAGLHGQRNLDGFVAISSDYHMERIKLYYDSTPDEINNLSPETKVVFFGNPVVRGQRGTNRLGEFLGHHGQHLDPRVFRLVEDSALPANVEATERSRDRKLYLAASLGSNAILDMLTVKGRLNEGKPTSYRKAFMQSVQRRNVDNTVTSIQESSDNKQIIIQNLPAQIQEAETYDNKSYAATLAAFTRLNILFAAVTSWADLKTEDEVRWIDVVWEKLVSVGQDLVDHYLRISPEDLATLRPELIPIIDRIREIDTQPETDILNDEKTALFYEILLLHCVNLPYYVDIHNVSKYLELLELKET